MSGRICVDCNNEVPGAGMHCSFCLPIETLAVEEVFTDNYKRKFSVRDSEAFEKYENSSVAHGVALAIRRKYELEDAYNEGRKERGE